PTRQQRRGVIKSHPNSRIAGPRGVVRKLSFRRMIVRSDGKDCRGRGTTELDPGIIRRQAMKCERDHIQKIELRIISEKQDLQYMVRSGDRCGFCRSIL